MTEPRVAIDATKTAQLARIVQSSSPPAEDESGDLAFSWTGSSDEMANAYFAIVAICHQTSPLGERRLEGEVAGTRRIGWDYLKGRYLAAAEINRCWTRPDYWEIITPADLAGMYDDPVAGRTLNRVNERVYLLNDLGRMLRRERMAGAVDVFRRAGHRFEGRSGFLHLVSSAAAYSDPVRKKSLFFCSIAQKECGWDAVDAGQLSSPVDYHELRGHLRIGTVRIIDEDLRAKVEQMIALTEEDDTAIRKAVQEANDDIAMRSGVTSSVLHYMLWNIFRNCCPRASDATHCQACTECKLPHQYKAMPTYAERCVFAGVCDSSAKPKKVVEPPYIGHFY